MCPRGLALRSQAKAAPQVGRYNAAPMSNRLEQFAATIAAQGQTFARATDMRPLLAQFGELTDWNTFAASWDGMPLDQYLAEGHRFRRRRYAVYRATRGVIGREPYQPHYQGREYNALFGGLPREFEPIPDAIGGGPSMWAILNFCDALFSRLAPEVLNWHVETHQFRIETTPALAGQPTPEGSHRDGVDYVCVLLVRRQNIASGTTTIHTPDGKPLGEFTLTDALDSALIDDHRVYHGVTPVQPLDPAAPAYRDVLVVTFRRS